MYLFQIGLYELTNNYPGTTSRFTTWELDGKCSMLRVDWRIYLFSIQKYVYVACMIS